MNYAVGSVLNFKNRFSAKDGSYDLSCFVLFNSFNCTFIHRLLSPPSPFKPLKR